MAIVSEPQTIAAEVLRDTAAGADSGKYESCPRPQLGASH